MNCNQCGRKVKDHFTDKWNHILQYHPRVALTNLLPMLFDERRAELIGSYIGNALRKRLDRVL